MVNPKIVMIEWMITETIPILGNLHMFLLEQPQSWQDVFVEPWMQDLGDPGSLVKWRLKNDEKVDQRGILFSDKAIVVLLERSI